MGGDMDQGAYKDYATLRRRFQDLGARPRQTAVDAMEALALAEGLRWAVTHAHGAPVTCHTDSLRVLDRMLGIKLCDGPLAGLCGEAVALAHQLGAVVRWVPRWQNKRADRLCRQAVQAYLARQCA